jgi:hypothetical protein
MCVRHDIEWSRHSRFRLQCRDGMDWLVGDCMSNKQTLVDEEVLEDSYSCRCSATGRLALGEVLMVDESYIGKSFARVSFKLKLAVDKSDKMSA